MKKLKKKNGETLAETLIALVITALALLMLPGAVVASSRVNASIKEQIIYMEKISDATSGTDVGTCDVTFSCGTNSNTISGVDVLRFGTEDTGLYEVGLNNQQEGICYEKIHKQNETE